MLEYCGVYFKRTKDDKIDYGVKINHIIRRLGKKTKEVVEFEYFSTIEEAKEYNEELKRKTNERYKTMGSPRRVRK